MCTMPNEPFSIAVWIPLSESLNLHLLEHAEVLLYIFLLKVLVCSIIFIIISLSDFLHRRTNSSNPI